MTDTIGSRFMLETRNPTSEVSPQRQGIPQPALELPFPDADMILLPPAADITVPPMELRQAIEQRQTIRTYSSASLSMEELSYLLWCTQGVKKVSSRPVTLRNVPSAGARHAFETVMLINRVAGLPPGVYRYAAIRHGLVTLSLEPGLAENLKDACLRQDQVINSAVTFFWVAIVERMTWRYMQRGYRYLHLDAGHVCQNLYLAAESLGCGVCAIAAFEDEALNLILGLDGETSFVIYAASLGKKPNP